MDRFLYRRPKTPAAAASSSETHKRARATGDGGSAGAGAGAGTGAGAAEAGRRRPARARATTAKAKGEDEAKPLADVTVPEMGALTAAQARAITLVNEGRHVFLTGCAGCGKTRTALALKAALTRAGTPFEFTASTGVAAELLGGGTLHSFLCLGIDEDETPATVVARARRYRRERIKRMRLLLIDEVSMLSAETLQLALHVLRGVRAPAPLPVIVLVGDFLQLPPVKGALALDSAAWADLDPAVVCLARSFRQAGDSAFLDILNEARVGKLGPGSIDALRSRVGAPIVRPTADAADADAGDADGGTDDVHVDADADDADADDDADDADPTVLHSNRAPVEAVNLSRLRTLPGPDVVFPAYVFVGHRDDPNEPWRPLPGSTAVAGRLLVRDLVGLQVTRPVGVSDEDMVFEATKAVGACLTTTPPVLTLRKGAQVMFTANVGKGIANGTRGTVVGFVDGLPQVRLLASGRKVLATTLQRSRLPERTQTVTALAAWAPSPSSDKALSVADTGPVVVCEQVPLRLAWAVTIHKSQGSTLPMVHMNLRLFAEGQGYVALSRAPSLDAITLEAFDPASFRANVKVVEWYAAHTPLDDDEGAKGTEGV